MTDNSRLDPYIPRIPVLATAGASYRFVFGNLRLLLVCATLPLIASEIMWFASYLSAGRFWGSIIFDFISVLPAALFGVAWCRCALLGRELARPRLANRWTRRHLRFAGVLLLVALIIVPVRDGFIQLVIRTDTNIGLFGIGVYLVVLTFCVAITLRFQLSLPAHAVDARGSIGRVWDLSREQGFRLLFSAALVYVPVSIIQQIANEVFEIVTGLSSDWGTLDDVADFDPRYIFISVFNAICDYLLAALIFLVFCFSFRRITGWEPPVPPSLLERFD